MKDDMSLKAKSWDISYWGGRVLFLIDGIFDYAGINITVWVASSDADFVFCRHRLAIHLDLRYNGGGWNLVRGMKF